jgi:hypothetical protein
MCVVDMTHVFTEKRITATLVESVAANLLELGYQPQRIRTERLGSTGNQLISDSYDLTIESYRR